MTELASGLTLRTLAALQKNGARKKEKMNRVVYLRDRSINCFAKSNGDMSRGAPCGCLISKVDREANIISYAYSMAHPNSMFCPGDRFNKKLGKLIAEGRLAKKPITIAGPVPVSGHDINKLIFQHIADTTTARTLRKIAKEWLAAASIPRSQAAAV